MDSVADNGCGGGIGEYCAAGLDVPAATAMSESVLTFCPAAADRPFSASAPTDSTAVTLSRLFRDAIRAASAIRPAKVKLAGTGPVLFDAGVGSEAETALIPANSAARSAACSVAAIKSGPGFGRASSTGVSNRLVGCAG